MCVDIIVLDNANVDIHLISEVLVSSDEGVAMFVLKADTKGSTRTIVKTVEVLNGGDDGLCSIVLIYLYSHRKTRLELWVVGDQELECDVLRWELGVWGWKLHDLVWVTSGHVRMNLDVRGTWRSRQVVSSSLLSVEVHCAGFVCVCSGMLVCGLAW